MPNVLVLVDHEAGTPKKIANQMLTAARERGGGEVHAAVFGEGSSTGADKLGAYGVAKAFVWDDPEAGAYATEPLVVALQAALEASGAPILLYPADQFLSDVVARTAVRVRAGVITDAVDLSLDGEKLVATKAIFGGEMTSRCQVRGDRPQFLGIKANSFTAEEVGGGPAQVVPLDVTLDDRAKRVRVVDTVEQTVGSRPDVTEASIIVAGGRGLGDAGGFRAVEELADALGGAVGASRAATDAGWYPHQHQIGQTGKTVSPALYIGVGISGAIQHRAGMQTSQTIVAINKDAEAPLHSIADLAVVGDLHKILPPLVDEIRKRRD
jgi:electron transfer flavoprotein alpha subunit